MPVTIIGAATVSAMTSAVAVTSADYLPEPQVMVASEFTSVV